MVKKNAYTAVDWDKTSTFNFEQLNLAYFVQLAHMIPR